MTLNMVSAKPVMQQEIFIQDNIKRGNDQVKVLSNGPMEEDTEENGETTKWKDKVYLSGPMAVNTKETTLMTKRKATAPSIGKFIIILLS